MNKLSLQARPHNFKIGDSCPKTEPSISDDVIIVEGGESIGFFLRKIPDKMTRLIEIANTEFRSERVPKTEMSRGAQGSIEDKIERARLGKVIVTQYSTIIGAVAPKPHMRRDYPTMSSVHNVKSAHNYIKAMLLLAAECELLIKQILPMQYESQLKLFESISDKWKLSPIFTSSIANYNIAAGYHKDNANLIGSVNAIITKRKNCTGGNLNVPDYGATFDQCDNSILVYPAWKNLHGVTPIFPTKKGGYRNSFIFYPLKAFVGLT